MAKSASPTPKTVHSWDRPSNRAPQGDEDPNEIFRTVGFALTHWEFVEEHLAQLFSLLIGQSEPSVAAVRAFGAIATSRGRLEMIQAAAEVYFADYPDPALADTFKQIMTACGGFASRRNEIAHGMVRYVNSANGEREFFLVSPFYNTPKMKLATGSVYAFTSSQIFTYALRFVDLFEDLDRFYWRLNARVIARESYGGTLTPKQIARLDRLLLDPTAQRHLLLRRALRT